MDSKTSRCIKKAEECIAGAITYLCAIHGQDAPAVRNILSATRDVQRQLHRIIITEGRASQ